MQSPSAVRARRAESMQTMNTTGTRAAISAKRVVDRPVIGARRGEVRVGLSEVLQVGAVVGGTPRDSTCATGVQSGVEPMTRIRAPSTAIDVTRLRLAKD